MGTRAFRYVRTGASQTPQVLGRGRLPPGRYDPSLPLAFTIARVFGLTIEEIFFPDDDAS